MEEKIPCFAFKDEKQFNEIIEHLKNWNYKTETYCGVKLENYKLLVINCDGQFGNCINITNDTINRTNYNRKIINDKDTFLYLAAELKGYKYIKCEFNINDLKNGMVVRYRNSEKALVLNNILIEEHSCDYLDNFKFDLTNKNDPNKDIVKIYKPAKTWTYGFYGGMSYGDEIWERKESVIMSIEEIENKLNLKKGTLIIE